MNNEHDKLFKQPPPKEDCPICFVRMPKVYTGYRYYPCCGKVICSGCVYAPVYDNQGNKVNNEKCPFCRTSRPDSYEESLEREKKRMEKNDAIAIHNTGVHYLEGRNGFPQDLTKAFEFWYRSAELGNAKAYSSIGNVIAGRVACEVDMKKAIYFWELAAMGGCEVARYNLGDYEEQAGSMDNALRHFIIAVGSGEGDSLKRIQKLYSDGHATKDDYTGALKVYQSYLSEIKNPQRDKAAAADDGYRYY